MLRILTAASAMAVAIALVPARADDLSNRASALLRQSEMAIHQNKPAEFAAMYTDDAIVVPPGQPPIMGRRAIEQWAKANLSAFSTLKLAATHTGSAGEIGWIVGTWTADARMPDGKAMTMSGNTVTVVQQHGQSWLIKLDTWNVNPPPAATAAK
jgi:uncharacterized protein (TIGR02246 family)